VFFAELRFHLKVRGAKLLVATQGAPVLIAHLRQADARMSKFCQVNLTISQIARLAKPLAASTSRS
jgi:hypothetical protein